MLGSMRYLGTGWRLVRTPGLRRFVLAPLAVNLVVFGGLGWWAIADVRRLARRLGRVRTLR